MDNLKLEPLPQYTLPAQLVEQLFHYLGTKPAVESEGFRVVLSNEVAAQQQAAALAKLTPPDPPKE